MDSVAMLTSYSLQYGVPLRTLVDKFRGVHFEPAGFTSNPDIPQATSLVDYIFRWLELKFLTGPGAASEEQARTSGPAPARASAADIGTGLLCPDCGSQLVFAEGCLICRNCGYTKCG
jgi:ribonucleoside-diphosphate reductase alpha chain